MSSTLLGLLFIVLIAMTAFVLWKLSRWISVRVTGSGDGTLAPVGRPGAEPSVAGQLRPDATVPVARLRRGRRAPYALGDRSLSERVVADDLRSPSSRHEELPSLATVGALPPAARLDVGFLLTR